MVGKAAVSSLSAKPRDKALLHFQKFPCRREVGPQAMSSLRAIREPEPIGEVQRQWVHGLDFCLFAGPLFKRQSCRLFTEGFLGTLGGVPGATVEGGGVNALG